ncbi:hypothetical protein, partial [Acetobacter pasteurianus]|uniref:hypothetical protein n=1 Tax=Acetobacter pasteurianus TaxID=438 RepID=UPI00162ADBAF
EPAATGTLGRSKGLGDEGLEPLGARRADATQTGPEVILAGHWTLQCAKKAGATKENRVGKHCQRRGNIAERTKKRRKTDTPTEAQCAPFYLASP